MELLGISHDQGNRGIPFKDRASLEEALLYYARGETLEGRSASQRIIGEFTEDGVGDTRDLFAEFDMCQQPTEAFVAAMLEKADEGIKSKGFWNQTFDYWCPAAFRQTNVTIFGGENEKGYVLELWAGNTRAEEDLAQYLEVEQPLICKSVSVHYAPTNGTFVIDFDDILPRITPWRSKLAAPSVGLQTGKALAQYFYTHEQGAYSLVANLGRQGDLEVSLSLPHDSVGDGCTAPGEFVWTMEGAVLTTPLRRNYLGEVNTRPSIAFSVRKPTKNDGWRSAPIMEEETLAEVDRLISVISNSFISQKAA